MKRLLYLITKSERGGAQLHLADLLKGFKGRYEIGVGVGVEGFITDVARDLSHQAIMLPHLINPISPPNDLRAYGEVTRLIQGFAPDIVHCHSSKAGIIGRISAWRLGVPTVFTAHGWAFAEGSSFSQRSIAIPVEYVASKTGGPILCVCEKDRNLAMRYKIARGSQIRVIHNGVRDNASRANPGSGASLRIGMVARFAPPKDYSLLVRALTRLSPHTQMVFIGDGPDRSSVEHLARELGVHDRIQFKGTITDVRAEMAKVDVLALATKYEGFPLSILEGMQVGLPIVASDVGGISEAVVHGETGFLFPRGDLNSLTECLIKFENNRELLCSMGAKGRTRYERFFTVDTMLQKIAEVYSTLQPKD